VTASVTGRQAVTLCDAASSRRNDIDGCPDAAVLGGGAPHHSGASCTWAEFSSISKRILELPQPPIQWVPGALSL